MTKWPMTWSSNDQADPSLVSGVGQRLAAPVRVAAAAVLACAAVWWGDPTTPGGWLPRCPIKMLLGIDCPGCGTLRMLYSLLHGDLAGAAKFNALALAGLLVAVWAYAVWTYGRLVRRQPPKWPDVRWAASVTLVVVSLWFVVRNLPFSPFTALRV